jgi:sugar phosphate isomerase/epimerase
MKLGFVSAVFPDQSLEEVLSFAKAEGFSCVELMCWPPGKADRRYAGVSHLDVTNLDVARVRDQISASGVSISSLGYYPNPLQADRERGEFEAAHIKKVIDASAALGIGTMTTFIGRDPALTIDDNWPRFLEVWRPILAHAEYRGVRIGIENCPMSFGKDEWPGGKNLAVSPAIWRRMFTDIPSPNFGLNFDPSHFVLQMMDYVGFLGEFGTRIHHIHAKDARIDLAGLNDHGVFSFPKLWHSPKLPGMGDVHWGRFFAALNDATYHGPVCIEVEDHAFESSLERRQESLRVSRNYLRQFVAG